MSSQTLSAVAIHVVDQYSSAGKHLTQAYRTGVERLVGGANARYASFLQNRSIPLVNEKVKSDLINAQQVLAGFLLKGVHAGSDRATLAAQLADKIAQGAKAVETRIGSVSEEAAEANVVVAKPARRAVRKA